MLSLLSLCVTAALLLPLCCGTTIYPQQDEATPTPDYPDYTFDYDGNTTFSYEMYAVLNPEGKIDAKAGGSDANKVKKMCADGTWTLCFSTGTDSTTVLPTNMNGAEHQRI